MGIFARHLPCNIIFFTSFLQSACVCCRLQNAGIVIFNRSLISTLLNLLCKKKTKQKKTTKTSISDPVPLSKLNKRIWLGSACRWEFKE